MTPKTIFAAHGPTNSRLPTRYDPGQPRLTTRPRRCPEVAHLLPTDAPRLPNTAPILPSKSQPECRTSGQSAVAAPRNLGWHCGCS